MFGRDPFSSQGPGDGEHEDAVDRALFLFLATVFIVLLLGPTL